MRLLGVDIDDFRFERMASGCLEWRGATSRGYGSVIRGCGEQRRSIRVHRLACEATNGPPPEGKTHALHRCNNRLCVEGSHLYWGNDADNAADRKRAGTARGGKANATHCVRGHPFNAENTYWEPRGWGRACKACRREAVRRYRRKLAA